MPLSPWQATTLELHRKLDMIWVPELAWRFISGPQTTHPFIHEYLDGVEIDSDVKLKDYIENYNFLQDELELTDTIRKFHKDTDGIDYSPTEIMVTAGSSPLILGIMTFLREQAVRSISYFRPIYHTFYFLADLFDIELRPLCDEPLWGDASMQLPPEGQHALLFADPIWFAGRAVSEDTIDAIRRWQDRTGSTVIVDGTFQFLKWHSQEKKEGSAELNREHTIRLICPTKSLALHGIRFAYLLGPARLLERIRWICDNITGSVSTFDMHCAKRIMRVLASPNGNRNLREYIVARYSELRANGYIERTIVEPNCGYYVFGNVSRREKLDLFLDCRYFEVVAPTEFVRINVLSPFIPS